MHTNRSETRQISIDAAPDDVLDIVGDARALPRWAPNFATTVEPDGDHWIVNGELHIDLRVDRVLGTADILRLADPRTGAFSRVVPNGAGSEYLFTLFFPDGTDETAIVAQMAVVEEELRTVRALAEPAARG
ncbi:SRPBCC family protein [Solirubrobacter soli]|uniref:SRPBCC family protein n=1 Tax=Solirubrobacter soli TaxID=363832 RepID=UPI000419271D|nr:SRPBCC family protein [Solirubrobacter soli]